jgi:hypothetical protein
VEQVVLVPVVVRVELVALLLAVTSLTPQVLQEVLDPQALEVMVLLAL